MSNSVPVLMPVLMPVVVLVIALSFSVRTAGQQPVAAVPVEDQVEDAPSSSGRRQAARRLDPPDLPVGDEVVRRVRAGGLPPGPGLDPVADHVADLPQPPPPEEL